MQAATAPVNLFPASANAIYWLAIGLVAAMALGVPAALVAWARTPYATGEGEPVVQPVKFDHRHHVRDDGIDCVYCHAGVRRSARAGVPATSVCMGCHAQIWTSSPELAPVRRSYVEGTPIRWQRVTTMPDFVFFDHSVHVNHGVGCVTCHGRVDQMAQVYMAEPMTMRFCLDCHRDPDPHLRPPEAVTDMEWTPAGSPREVGRAIGRELGVESIVDCTGCHR